jgi:hypothetical protein
MSTKKELGKVAVKQNQTEKSAFLAKWNLIASCREKIFKRLQIEVERVKTLFNKLMEKNFNSLLADVTRESFNIDEDTANHYVRAYFALILHLDDTLLYIQNGRVLTPFQAHENLDCMCPKSTAVNYFRHGGNYNTDIQLNYASVDGIEFFIKESLRDIRTEYNDLKVLHCTNKEDLLFN